jgi:WhiB family redox-sensing transcriptional regulator
MTPTEREQRIRALARQELARDDIAMLLGIGTQTVSRDVRIMARRTAVELAKQAARTRIPEGADWRARGLCARSDDPDIWFRGRDLVAVATAEAVCARCPVAAMCAAAAVARREKAGVWGGRTTPQRRHRAVTGQEAPG